jgi:hypothetical protein
LPCYQGEYNNEKCMGKTLQKMLEKCSTGIKIGKIDPFGEKS